MILGRIVGTVVSTRKDDKLAGAKLLVVRAVDPRASADSPKKTQASYLIAVDTVDAGVGDKVLVVSGSSARMAAGLKDTPVDAAIVGVVDTVEIED